MDPVANKERIIIIRNTVMYLQLSQLVDQCCLPVILSCKLSVRTSGEEERGHFQGNRVDEN